jgi:uncharacterized membrane protein
MKQACNHATEGREKKRGSSQFRTPKQSSIADLTRRNVEVIAQLEEAAGSRRGPGDRLADLITRFVGSMTFVYLHVAWFGLWILLNSTPLLPESWRFDSFPFTFLTFVVSLEAIFLSTFILISQNHEERLAQRRSHLDLQINLLSEQENSKMLQMLESIQQHLGMETDAAAAQLEQETEPERIAQEIEKRIEEKPSKGR